MKVLDFGIAKGLALSRKLTRNDFGSLSYLSPERLDTGEVDPHVDFWSVGVLLYEMVAGAAPYEADTSQALESLIRSRQPPAPLPESCPPALARIILKMLAGSPTRRYADAGLIRHDLQALRRGEPTVADAEWMALQPEGETRRTGVPVAIAVQGGRDVSASGGVAVAAIDAGDATRRTEAAADVLIEAEATRRTDAGPPTAEADSEATRRTVLAAAGAAVPIPPIPAVPSSPRSRAPIRARASAGGPPPCSS